MDDNKGTSLILTHTAKGEKMMNAVSENIKCEQVIWNRRQEKIHRY